MLAHMKRRVVIALAFLAAFMANTVAHARCLPAPPPDILPESENAEPALAAGPIGNDRIGRMVAPVMVNGRGPYRFIIDTGANRSVVSEQLATQLGLQPVGEGTVHTVHGATQAQIVSVDSLTYGDLELPGSQLPMLQGAVLAGEHGLLGVDGMAGRRLLLDFENRCIEISPARRSAPLRGIWTGIRGELRFGHLVVVRGRVDGLRVNVIIDSGSNTSLANRAMHRMMDERVRYDRNAASTDFARIYSAGDAIVLDTAIVLPRLEVADLTVTDMILYVGDFHIFQLWGLIDEPTVLIGMDVLANARGMAIDYDRGMVYFRLRDRRTGSNIRY